METTRVFKLTLQNTSSDRHFVDFSLKQLKSIVIIDMVIITAIPHTEVDPF